ncbi:protein ACCELERATED CELL DEATH 6 [Cinnamomum micranthum f. kanehirae]|uniref:Protein ACCELERATED CELL DEATH 6 n=1 Tax=Cinnamomum micranthum f. kanehirae TaxID=337451 RepID=A0A3S3NRN9_9MAGN|nr:protein ACCELERATED CELL DEATH 6 [Cinnamomum micranthum f. kanehirae]
MARNTGTIDMAHARSQGIRSAVSNTNLDRTLAEHTDLDRTPARRVLLLWHITVVPWCQWYLSDTQPSSPRTESTSLSSPSSLQLLKTGYGAAAAAGNRTQLTCTLQEDRWRRCLTGQRHVSSDVCRRRSGAAPFCSFCKPRQDVVKVLIQEWPSLTERRDSYSNTPLHYAASLGNLEMVRIFLQSNISANYIMDEDGRTPFLVAAKNGHGGVIMELLQFCPDSAEVADKKGRNVLHVAVKSGKLEVIRYILKLYDHKELINEPDNEGNTPLHLAIIKRHISVLNLLLKDKEVDTRAMNNNGMTALDIAESDKELTMKFRKIVICTALIQAGA